ncbi:MAG: DUF1854 domain-containing protein [Nitrososphaerota archaeon]|nr:DUF1854 domain-containing protein [Candidatus Bathyarchaeota archaeon]MCX8162296.1 DUF1854 domain-containing protein [Candidatus Bathyarchaeota archaeon]MDW8062047.1 DUF1854 domain-containing protein [Nitrososphaerota archaeon]
MSSVKDYAKASFRIVDPDEVRIEYDENEDLLTIYIDGKVYRGVEPIKPFPLSNPYYVLFRSTLTHEDVCVVRDIRRLKREQRSLLEAVLNKRYFIPSIVDVYDITYTGEYYVCRVKTDRGDRIFKIIGRRNVYRIDDKIVIIDVDENIYLIESYEKMGRRAKEELMKII